MCRAKQRGLVKEYGISVHASEITCTHKFMSSNMEVMNCKLGFVFLADGVYHLVVPISHSQRYQKLMLLRCKLKHEWSNRRKFAVLL